MRRALPVLTLLLLTGCCGRGGGGSSSWEEERVRLAPAVAVAEPETPAESDLACFGARIETRVDEMIQLREVADLDADGRLDVVLQSSRLEDGEFTSMLTAMRGEGDGRFTPTDLHSIGPFSYSASAADLDGDGHLDLLANDHDRGAVAVFHGAGDGTFRKGAGVKVHGKPGEVTPADLDADGDVDLIVSRYRSLEIWTNDGAASFRHHTTLQTGRAPEPPVVVDLDLAVGATPSEGDHVDLVVVDNDDCTYRVFRGNGKGRFHEAHRGDSCCPPASVRVGEFNSDGMPDVAWICHAEGVQLAVLEDTQTVFRLEAVDQVRADRMAVADVNGDGHDDLLVFDEMSLDEIPPGEGMWTKVNLLAGNGDLGFTGLDQRMWKGQYGAPVLADVTGDGKLDLLADNWQGNDPGYLVVWPGIDCP